jgi:hypothetical protein
MNSGKINSLIPNNNTWPSIIAKYAMRDSGLNLKCFLKIIKK